MPSSIAVRAAAVMAIVTAVPAVAAPDAAYPTKPVRMIVPLAPGGGSDIVARMFARAMGEKWAQSVVVDNRPGAGSTIGTAIAARATPDGHTLMTTSSSFVIGAVLYPALPYDVMRDFAAITLIASQPSIIAVNPAVKAKSLQELVALMKAAPGKLGFGSAGQGTASHLANELFLMSAGAKATHIPYKSAGLAATALLGGEIQFMVTNMATAVPLVQSGKLRGLAVTSAQRAPAVGSIPTAAESGLAGFEYATWYGMVAPAGTPGARLGRIHADALSVIRSPELAARFAAVGLDMRPSTRTQFAEYVRSELQQWSKVVEAAGLRKK